MQPLHLGAPTRNAAAQTACGKSMHHPGEPILQHIYARRHADQADSRNAPRRQAAASSIRVNYFPFCTILRNT
jgi:hypothetical protein